MAFSYEAKSTVGSLFVSTKLFRKLISSVPPFIINLLKYVDVSLTFLEAVLFTLLLPSMYDVPMPDVKSELKQLLDTFYWNNELFTHRFINWW